MLGLRNRVEDLLMSFLFHQKRGCHTFVRHPLYLFQKDIARKALKGEILVAHVAYENGYVSKLFFEKL